MKIGGRGVMLEIQNILDYLGVPHGPVYPFLPISWKMNKTNPRLILVHSSINNINIKYSNVVVKYSNACR